MLEFTVASSSLELREDDCSAKGGLSIGSGRMILVRDPFGDPAAAAARFLRRLAFIILMIVAPVGEVLSRGVLYILLPVGAAILVIAGLLDGAELARRRIVDAFMTSIGIAVVFLTFWAALSLVWTPFPIDAGAQLGRTLLTGFITFLAIVSLPERARISNIYLLPVGVAITSVAAFLMILFGPDTFWQAADPDTTLAQRCIMSVSILLWPALGALALRERFIMAAALAFVVAAAVLAVFTQIALIALLVATLAYVIAMTDALRTARIIASALAVLMLGAPLFVALLYPFIVLAHAAYGSPILVFSDLVVHEWPRFITGHGLDMAERAIALGLLPPDTPRSIVFTLWYELGIVGVAAFTFLASAVLLAVGRLPQHVAPAILAALVAGLVIAIFGAETIQLWWITLNGMAAIALALLVKAHPQSKRPLAPAPDEEAELEEGMDFDHEPQF